MTERQYTTIKMRVGAQGRLVVINVLPHLDAEHRVDRWLMKTPGLFGRVFKVDGGTPARHSDQPLLARLSPVRDRAGYVVVVTPFGDELPVQMTTASAEEFCRDNGWQYMTVDEAGARPAEVSLW